MRQLTLPIGHTVTRKGHVRLTAGPQRNQYLHRVLWKELTAEQRRLGVALLLRTNPEMTEELLGWLQRQEAEAAPCPPGLVCHHMDWDPANNQPGNLLFCEQDFHSSWDPQQYRGRDGRYHRYKAAGRRSKHQRGA